MIAFASNSLLCRAALRDTEIDAASFTFVRIVAGAIALWLIVTIKSHLSSPVTNAVPIPTRAAAANRENAAVVLDRADVDLVAVHWENVEPGASNVQFSKSELRGGR